MTLQHPKKNGAFVAEYQPITNPIIINDSLKITIEEAWIEHYWVYCDTPGGVFLVSDVYHFCINTKKEDLNGFEKDWSIGIDFDKNMRGSSEESLIGTLILCRVILYTILYRRENRFEREEISRY